MKSIVAAALVACFVTVCLFSLHWLYPLTNCGETRWDFKHRGLISAGLAAVTVVPAFLDAVRRVFWGALSVFLVGGSLLLFLATPFFC